MFKKFLTPVIISAFILNVGMVSAQSATSDSSQNNTESVLSGIIISLQSIVAQLKNSFTQIDTKSSTALTALSTTQTGIGLHNTTPQMEMSAITSTSVGGRAQSNRSVTVYQDPNPSSFARGTQPLGAVGTVTAGPEYYTPPGCEYSAAIALIDTCTVTAFMYMNFDTGADGWVRQSYIVPAASGKFITGSRLGVNTSTSVRSSAGGTTVGSQPVGAVGTVTGSPVRSGTSVWWPVNFDAGTDGWVSESGITNQGVPLSLPALERFEITAPLPTGSALETFGSKINISANDLNLLATRLREGGAPAPSAATPMQIFEDENGLKFAFIESDEMGNFVVAAAPANANSAISISIMDPSSIEASLTLNAVIRQYTGGNFTTPTKEIIVTAQFNEDRTITYLITQQNAEGLLEIVHSSTLPGLTSADIDEMIRKGAPSLPDREPRDPYEDTVTFGFTVDPNDNASVNNEPPLNIDTGWGSVDVEPGCSSTSCTSDNFRIPEEKFDTDFSYDSNSWLDTLIDTY